MLKPPTSIVGPYPHKAGRLVHHGTLEKKNSSDQGTVGWFASCRMRHLNYLAGGGRRRFLLGEETITLW